MRNDPTDPIRKDRRRFLQNAAWTSAAVGVGAGTGTAWAAGGNGNTDAARAVHQEKGQGLFSDSEDFIEIIQRDENLDTRPTGYAPQDAEPDHVFTLELGEGKVPIGQGVIYDGFTINGKVPGPTIHVREGDIVRMEFKNVGEVPHGASIHTAYTQTSKYLGAIPAGETQGVTFRATTPGVYMYHCAPGGHAIPMHVMFGQYGMMVVDPVKPYKLEEDLGRGPDLEIHFLQHELYASGKEAVEEEPLYTAFNGQLFRYAEEPIMAKPGDYVRLYYLNVGPNQLSTFHGVGIIWDYAYWQGHPDAGRPGGQTITSGPSDSWVVEFRVPPDEGGYLLLDHAVGHTSRGAIGLLMCDAEAERSPTIMAEGPDFTQDELDAAVANAERVIKPFGLPETNNPTPARCDRAVRYGPDVDEVVVEIKGNTYYPKIIEIEPGTKVTWVNEDVFTYDLGEASGAHNVAVTDGPEQPSTNMLRHAQSDSLTFEKPGEYNYLCAPHPYMRGRVIVRESSA